MFNRTLKSYVPTYYKGVQEMDSLMETEQPIMTEYQSEMLRAFQNTFVITADIEGIETFEYMLGIIANPSIEDLEFRRARILNRLQMSPPFTFRFLENKLDEIIGPGKYKAYIDFDNYTLYIESSASDQNWFTELQFTINQIKPCNIVFVNVPYTLYKMNIGEQISYIRPKWNYKLGSWLLGKYPFTNSDGGAIIKMSDVHSIQPKLLNDTAQYIHDKIKTVLINDIVRIESFTTDSVSENEVVIEYPVTQQNVSEIRNIKLLDEEDNVLSSSDVYVAVNQTIMSKHIIRVEEES